MRARRATSFRSIAEKHHQAQSADIIDTRLVILYIIYLFQPVTTRKVFVPFGRTFTRRRKLCIACGDFSLKSRRSLTPLLLHSAKGHARFACSLASALATALCRCQPFAVFCSTGEIRYEYSYHRTEPPFLFRSAVGTKCFASAQREAAFGCEISIGREVCLRHDM